LAAAQTAISAGGNSSVRSTANRGFDERWPNDFNAWLKKIFDGVFGGFAVV